MEQGFPGDAWDDGRRIVVRIDRDIEDLIPKYLEMTRKDIVSLKSALALGDFDAISRIGHTLKGSGGGYGFDGITEIGRNLEQLAKSAAREDIERWVERLAMYLERVEVVPE